VEQVPLQVIGSFDLFFPDIDGVDYWEINGNVVYLVEVPRSPISPYVGVGLNVARASVETTVLGQPVSASDTEIGLNLLGGVQFEAAPKVKPYGEVRFEVSGGEQIPVITAGVAFNVGPGPGM
jgi:opacity protein-like surface antigen